MANVVASEVLVAGLRTEFADTYLKQKRESDSRLGLIMDLNITSDKRQEIYGYMKEAPHAAYWKRGTSIPEQGMPSVQFRLANLNWGRRVKWAKDDRDDDMTGTLVDAARASGRSFSALPERWFFDLYNGSTLILPSIPLAPDGVAFFSAVDGRGQPRFGITGGNVVVGTGVADPMAIIADYYTAIERYKTMKDDFGQPLHDDQAVDSGMVVVFGAHNTKAFEQAFEQKRIGELIAGTNGVATPTNILHDASRTTRLWGSQRITDDTWGVFMLNPPKKSCFVQSRSGLEEKFATMDNSDSARDRDEEYIQWKLRGNAGIALPYGAIKVTPP